MKLLETKVVTKQRKTLALVALLGCCAAGVAAVPSQQLESSVETSANLVSLPADIRGNLQVRACAQCDLLSFRLDANVQLVAGGKVQTLPLFRSLLANMGQQPLTIHYRVKDSIVTRISALIR
jgi:hypothetical protein